MNVVWDQQTPQPSVQLSCQSGQSFVSGSPQQPAQPTTQISTPGAAQQFGPSSPRTLSQTSVATTTASVQSTPPISGVSAAPVSTAPVSTPRASLPQSGPTIQTLVSMPVGQPGPSTVVTSQPQFTYQPYQG